MANLHSSPTEWYSPTLTLRPVLPGQLTVSTTLTRVLILGSILSGSAVTGQFGFLSDRPHGRRAGHRNPFCALGRILLRRRADALARDDENGVGDRAGDRRGAGFAESRPICRRRSGPERASRPARLVMAMAALTRAAEFTNGVRPGPCRLPETTATANSAAPPRGWTVRPDMCSKRSRSPELLRLYNAGKRNLA